MMEDRLHNILSEASNALPFLFIGSGFSRRYLNLDDWVSLLKHIASLVKPDNALAYTLFENKAKLTLRSKGLAEHKHALLPMVASEIEAELNILWFESPIFEESRNKYSDLAEQGISPLKIEVANYINSKADISNINATYNEELELFKALSKQSIAGIITTNYDPLIENMLSTDFTAHIGQDDLIFNSMIGIGDVFKIHGCSTSPGSLILTHEDYTLFHERNAYLAAKLLTIFLEHPIIFIGYSISDTNIREILTSIALCLTPERARTLNRRMFFVTRTGGENEIASTHMQFDSQSVDMTEIKLNDFRILYRAMSDIKAKYPVKFLRMLKNDVYDLVESNSPNSRVTMLNLDSSDLGNYEIVAGVGITSLGKRGYSHIRVDELYDDILKDDGGFVNAWLVEHSLDEMIKRSGGSVPIYKYIKDIEEASLSETVSKIIRHNYDLLLNKSLKTMHRRCTSFDQIRASSLSDIVKLKEISVLGKSSRLDVDLVRTFLIDLQASWAARGKDVYRETQISTEFKRLIRIVDWLENAPEGLTHLA